MNDENFSGKYAWLKKLGYVALLGLVILALAGLSHIKALLVIGILLVVPLLVFAYVLTFLHWKHRYIGEKSTLWGVLLAIETSGWFKIVYIFRHILPDIRKTGRYSK